MIGIFDSGIGGLTVLDALRKRMPHCDFVYAADRAHLPYGGREPEQIRQFAAQMADFLCDLEVEQIVIACNTASAVALPGLRLICRVPVWGMVDAGVDAATRATYSGRIAVIGTQATIASGIFQRKLAARGSRVWAQACPGLVHAAEERSPDAEALIRHYLRDMPRVDTLLLGCTHFPLLRATIQKIVGPRVRIVDGSEVLAAKVAADVADEGRGEVRYYDTGASIGKAGSITGIELSTIR